MASCHGFSRLVSVCWIWWRQMRCTQFVHWNFTFSILLKYYNPQNELRWTNEQPTCYLSTSRLHYHQPPVLLRLQVSQLHMCKYNSENNKLQRNNHVVVKTDSAKLNLKIAASSIPCLTIGNYLSLHDYSVFPTVKLHEALSSSC